MKPLTLLLLASALLGLLPFASDKNSTASEPFSGEILCLPGIYLQSPEDCLPAGPSAYMTDMARKGIILPLRGLQASPPDPSLPQVVGDILIFPKEAVTVYHTLDDAVARKPQTTLPAGMKYMVSSETVKVGSTIYYHLRRGGWVLKGKNGPECCVPVRRFQGLLFSQQPRYPFGWIIFETKSREAPGEDAPETSKQYFYTNIVQVYATQRVGDYDWVMIGLNEWIDRRNVALVLYDPTPPPGVTGDRWIDVNLFEQTVSVYDQGELVFATLIASGLRPYYTQPGLFKIREKKEFEIMGGAFKPDRSDYYYLENVPWTMYYDGNRALHGAYWRTFFGYPQSHGCVNLSTGDAAWLYHWAKVGDWVYIWDPSGKTPTDQQIYDSVGP
jgi:hypothetical protein